MRSIDEGMLAFVAWYGAIPANALRIDESQARRHTDAWVRRFIGEPSVSYAIGFASDKHWWTLFFDRLDELAPRGAEAWNIECYSSNGTSWSEGYFYWPEQNRWRHQFFGECGEDYGRHQTMAQQSR